MMAKYKITTAKKAANKGMVNEGDEVWVEATIFELYKDKMLIGTSEGARIFASKTKIRIPIPEPKPIDFGEVGRVLVNKENNLLICTTGYFDGNHFSGYLLKNTESYKKGYCFNSWSADDWQDITDTYNK